MGSKKTKTFDCIAMKREAQKAIRAKVRGMTRQEEVAFFRQGREEFDREVRAAKEQRSSRPSSDAT